MARRLAEIARKVGVSEATVSRVLNGKPGVADSTREAVLTALDVLGYERPTQLRGDRARLVGLVLPELQNPIFPAFAEVVADALAKRGFTPVLCTRTASGLPESAYVGMLLEQGVSGIIFFGGEYQEADSDHEHYRVLRERRLPVVLINAAFQDLGFPRVATDDAHAVTHALRHLRSLGHERIGLALGPGDHVPSQRKLAAFRLEAGNTVVEHTMFSLAGGQAAGDRLLDRGVTGIICASDILALGVVRAARRRGLQVGDDVSVIGFDDSPLMNCTDPPLTTVRQPIGQMARAAVSLLLGQIDGAPASTDELLFEPELVVRASSGRAPAKRPAAAAVSAR
jgi:DNA-binding LacI/PurR family transcriptional regulator